MLMFCFGFARYLESCTDTVYDIECITAFLCCSSGPCPSPLYITLLTAGLQHQIFQMLIIHNIAADFQQWEDTSCDIYSQAQILKRTWAYCPKSDPSQGCAVLSIRSESPDTGTKPHSAQRNLGSDVCCQDEGGRKCLSDMGILLCGVCCATGQQN